MSGDADPAMVIRKPDGSVQPALALRKEPFGIKVMRLPSPFLMTNLRFPVKMDQTNLLASNTIEPSEYALNSSLSLTANSGNVYLGEVFRSCVCITNQLRYAGSVGVKIELQTENKKVVLQDSTPRKKNFNFSPGETADFVVSTEITELNLNCLVCCISYVDEQGSSKTFQKFFKFPVFPPITIDTVLHQGQEVLLAEAQITNNQLRPLYLECVEFRPSPLFTATSLEPSPSPVPSSSTLLPTSSSASPSSLSAVYDSTRLLRPGVSQMFLFRVIEKEEAGKSAYSVGQCFVQWRSCMGETGSILTKPVCRSVLSSQSTIDLLMVSAPDTAELEAPFSLTLEARNQAGVPLYMVLHVHYDKMTGIIPYGKATQSLGLVAPGTVQQVTLQLLPIGLGVQKISGFRLTACESQHGTHSDHSLNKNKIVEKKGETSFDLDFSHHILVTRPE